MLHVLALHSTHRTRHELAGPVAEPVVLTLIWSGIFLAALFPLGAAAYRRQV